MSKPRVTYYYDGITIFEYRDLLVDSAYRGHRTVLLRLGTPYEALSDENDSQSRRCIWDATKNDNSCMLVNFIGAVVP